jgi:hypothetical protein
VEGAYTSSSTRGVPLARSTLTSSMLSAPHMIAAVIEVSFAGRVDRPGLHPGRRQIHVLVDSLERPACSASSSAGTSPAVGEVYLFRIKLKAPNQGPQCLRSGEAFVQRRVRPVGRRSVAWQWKPISPAADQFCGSRGAVGAGAGAAGPKPGGDVDRCEWGGQNRLAIQWRPSWLASSATGCGMWIWRRSPIPSWCP